MHKNIQCTVNSNFFIQIYFLLFKKFFHNYIKLLRTSTIIKTKADFHSSKIYMVQNDTYFVLEKTIS